MSNVVKIEAEFDLDQIKKKIEGALTLEKDEAFFEQLAEIQAVKTQLAAAEDFLKSVEADVKGLINAKAKALYGSDWQVISGEKFKITRSKTGDVYSIVGEPNKKFIKIKKSVDSKAVEAFVVEHSKLPAGIDINDQRGESLRITLK